MARAVKLDDAVAESTEQESKPKGLYPKLVAIMSEVDRVQKKGKNTGLKYEFVQETDVLELVRDVFMKYGVLMFPHSVENIVVNEKGAAAEKGFVISARYGYKVVDSETGQSDIVTVLAQGHDMTDKGSYKANTGATKYAIMKLLLLPTGEDPENDTRESKATTTVTKTDNSSSQSAPIDPLSALENIIKAAVDIGTYNDSQIRGLVKQESGVKIPSRDEPFNATQMRPIYSAISGYVKTKDEESFKSALRTIKAGA